MDAPLLSPPNPNLPEAPPRIFYLVPVVFLFTIVAVLDPTLLPIFTISSAAAAVAVSMFLFFPRNINHHSISQKVFQIGFILSILWGFHSFDLSHYNALIMVFYSALLGAFYGASISLSLFNLCLRFALLAILGLVIPSLLPDEFERKYVLFANLAAFAGFNILRVLWDENITRVYYGGVRPNPAANAVIAA